MNYLRKEKIIFAILIFLLLNIIFLDVKVFTKKKKSFFVTPVTEKHQQKEDKMSFVTPSVGIGGTDFCPLTCLKIISEATTSTRAQATPTLKPLTTPPMAKEFYIPLGTGSTASMDWVELTGVESVIDLANYSGVKSIIFEASMRIPTANGRAYAKLYNVTDKHDVWKSEVYAEGASGYRAEAKDIILSPGRKLYRVMMKSTMGYEAILDSARIKILLK